MLENTNLLESLHVRQESIDLQLAEIAEEKNKQQQKERELNELKENLSSKDKLSQKEKKRLRDLETSAQTNARYKKLYEDQKAEIKAQKKLIDDLIKEKEEVLKKTTIECIEFEKK